MSADSKKAVFYKLSPVQAESSELKESFDYVFDNDDITNIAIAGPYGSGKSSIILGALEKKKQEAQKKEEQLRSITVTLTAINSCNSEDKDLALEANLVSQLIHQIDPSHAKNSRLLTEKRPSIGQKVLLFLALTLLTVSAIYMATSDLWSPYLPDQSDVPINLIAGLVMTVSIVAIIALIVFGQAFRGLIQRLEIPGIGSAELFHSDDNKEPSSLDKYLDDILCLLETSEVDVVVFEDLDRWEGYEVLDKLHQINVLLNSDSSFRYPRSRLFKRNAKPVRFFYLLREDIFEAEDRVKFFDFIITVLPYSDYNNSADLFIKCARKADIAIDEGYLKQISHYIADSRLINNIVNEFQQFRSWNHIDDPDKQSNETENISLFSIVTYKNMFPKDFALFQTERGYLYALLHSRENLIDDIVKDVSDEENPIQEKLKRNALSQNLYAKSLSEILQEHPDKRNKFFSLDYSTDPFKATLKATAKKLPNADFIDFLVWNGYVDEGCCVYISRFHGVSMSRKDNSFIRAIQSGSTVDLSFDFDNVETVISNLFDFQLAQRNVRVYELASRLLKYQFGNKEQSFFEGLRRDEDTEFIIGFMQSNLCHSEAIMKIAEQYPESVLPTDYIEDAEPDDIRYLVKLMLDVTDDIASLDGGIQHRLKVAISNDDAFFLTSEANDEVTLHKLEDLQVEMIDIDCANTPKEVLEEIIELGLYEPNYDIVRKFIIEIEGMAEESVVKNSFMTIVKGASDPSLRQSLNMKLSKLLERLLADDEYEPKESIEAVEWVLRRDDISDELKEKFIKLKPSNKINLEETTNIYWKSLLTHGVAEFTVDNIRCYFEDYAGEFDGQLTQFFNEHIVAGVINDETIKTFNNAIQFLDSFIKNEDIEYGPFEAFFKDYGVIPDELLLNRFTPDRLGVLFSNTNIAMSAARLNEIRHYYHEYLQQYVISHVEEYLELAEEELIAPTVEEVSFILNNDDDDYDISDEDKLRSLDFVDFQFKISPSYSDRVNELIIREHLDETDIATELGSLYQEAGESLKSAIVQAIIEKLSKGYTKVVLPVPAMVEVLKSSSIDEKTKADLLLDVINNQYKKSVSIRKCLEAAGYDELASLMPGTQRKIHPSPLEITIIKALQAKGLMGKMKAIKDQPGWYMLYGLKKLPE